MSWRDRTRRLLPYLIVAATGFLGAYLFAFFVLFPSPLVPVDEKVPDVVGLMYDDAVSKLQQTGFVAVRGETHPHATAPASAVLAQSPRAASVEPHGTHVTLTISAGQRLAQLPPVVGLSQQQAQVAIENAGFTIGDVVTQPSDAPKGQVLSTDPSSGASIPLPARVSMIVSGGAATVVMPDVVGRELPSARASIEQLGLGMLPVIVDTVSASAPNTVVAQTPAAGRVVPANSKVRLTVAP